MTKGTKGVSGFQRLIQPEDIIIVLNNAETPLKNSQVRDELVMLKPEIYGKHGDKKEISTDGVKRALIKMWKDGEINGRMDDVFGCYLWKPKEE